MNLRKQNGEKNDEVKIQKESRRKKALSCQIYRRALYFTQKYSLSSFSKKGNGIVDCGTEK
ncbi:hypothetical protein A0128_03910 [Leptospira tipperaryensis]|uniref:Uncharacterized protein n=1 Tax=Leptospira tipperaryensis TaxID=2564040 RepID=A0A1D7UU39_9LEPT|nr:hypothetical protein A0128_03910 [Leptospira tipperaryensis]